MATKTDNAGDTAKGSIRASNMAFSGANDIFSGIATIYNDIGDYENMTFEAMQDELNSTVFRANANSAIRVGRQEKTKIAEEGSKFAASQQNQIAQSGVIAGSGDTADIINETSVAVAKEMAAIESQAQINSNSLKRQASQKDIDAAYKKRMAKDSLSLAKASGFISSAFGGAKLGYAAGDE